MENLVNIDIEIDGQKKKSYKSSENVPANSKKSVLVSSSATMHSTSVDKPSSFPPQVKVITCYQNVHHARVFGTHLFNVDFSNAKRHVPRCVQNLKDGLHIDEICEYNNGCPFFRDRQREFLLMPIGLDATIDSVLLYAPNKDNCFVLSTIGNGIDIKIVQQKAIKAQQELENAQQRKIKAENELGQSQQDMVIANKKVENIKQNKLLDESIAPGFSKYGVDVQFTDYGHKMIQAEQMVTDATKRINIAD